MISAFLKTEMYVTYDELKKIAAEVRAELVMRGEIDISKGKVRRKPRDKEKADLLLTMALERIKKYPPQRVGDTIILPYFFR